MVTIIALEKDNNCKIKTTKADRSFLLFEKSSFWSFFFCFSNQKEMTISLTNDFFLKVSNFS